jgi:hypothetical protein
MSDVPEDSAQDRLPPERVAAPASPLEVGFPHFPNL